MAVNVYEGMFILDTNRYARDAANVSGQIPELIGKAGGQMLASRLWEERRLAYPIDGHRKGTYWLSYFKLESGELSGLTRQCQLSESILRTLFLKVDPRIADALVAHALADPAVLRREAEAAEQARTAELAKSARLPKAAAAVDVEVDVDELVGGDDE
ncbi:MAG: 30S ribosomal protein S6 [Pirellulales bacterium]